MLNFYLIKGERSSLSMHLSYEPQSRYIDIANQIGPVKETVGPKIGENIEMLLCFMFSLFWLIQSSLSNFDESTKKLNVKIEYKSIQTNIFIVSAAYLFKSFSSYIF